MSGGVRTFLEMLGFAIVIILLYNIAKKYLLSKIKVNRWVLLTIALVILVLGGFLPQKGILKFVPSAFFVMLLLWFMDLSGWGAARYKEKAAKKNKVVIKPKAKPNRVKNNK